MMLAATPEAKERSVDIVAMCTVSLLITPSKSTPLHSHSATVCSFCLLHCVCACHRPHSPLLPVSPSLPLTLTQSLLHPLHSGLRSAYAAGHSHSKPSSSTTQRPTQRLRSRSAAAANGCAVVTARSATHRPACAASAAPME